MYPPVLCHVIHQAFATDTEYIRDRISTYSFENRIDHASPCVTDSESESEHATSDCESVTNVAPIAISARTIPEKPSRYRPALACISRGMMYFGEIPAGSVPLAGEEGLQGGAASPLLVVRPEPVVAGTPMSSSGDGPEVAEKKLKEFEELRGAEEEGAPLKSPPKVRADYMHLTDDGKRELWLGLHHIAKHWKDLVGKTDFDTDKQTYETGKLVTEGWATNYFGEHGPEMPVVESLQVFLNNLRLVTHPDVHYRAKGPLAR